jgi:hypothetical protein
MIIILQSFVNKKSEAEQVDACLKTLENSASWLAFPLYLSTVKVRKCPKTPVKKLRGVVGRARKKKNFKFFLLKIT